jgi:hypothetical protein
MRQPALPFSKSERIVRYVLARTGRSVATRARYELERAKSGAL